MTAIPYIIVSERAFFSKSTWWQRLLALAVGILISYGAVLLFGLLILVNGWAFLLLVGIPAIICFYYEVEFWYILGLVLGLVFFVIHVILALFNYVTFPFPIFG